MQFSKRVVFVNSLIVIIPLFIIFVSLLVASQKNLLETSENAARDIVKVNVQNVNEKIRTFDLIETMINSNEEIRLFFISPESYQENEIIDILKNETTILEYVSSITPYLYSIRLFTENPNIPERWPTVLKGLRLTEAEKKRWIYDYQATYLGNQDFMKLPSICSTRPLYKNHRLIGYIQITVRMEDFFPSLYAEKSKEGVSEYLLFVDKNEENEKKLIPLENEKLLKNNGPLTGKQLERVEKTILTSGKTSGVKKIGHGTKIVAWEYISELDSYLIRMDQRKELIMDIIIDVLMLMVSFIIITVFLFFFVRYITNRLMSGMYTLIDGMKKVNAGDLSVQIPVTGDDEISESQQIFNSMTKQLTEQIQLIKTEQSLIADTEMKAMQNQINAHFLYNVLETIRMQAVLADQDEISESLQVLGKMMRYCLRWRVHRVTLAQEIEYIRSYVYILNIRNDYTISLEIDIPQDLMEIEIPKMTLQPLVENSFVHAIEATEADATLKVYAENAGERVNLVVQDFGCGMDRETLNKIRMYLEDDTYERDSKGSIGIKNIQQRLTVFYGKDYRLEIESEVGKGTKISVPVPNKQMK